MKVVSNRLVEVQEGNEMLQIAPVNLSVSVIKLSAECAQVLVIDPRPQVFTNFICVMNLNQDQQAGKQTSTVLVDDVGEEVKAQMADPTQADDEQTDTSDLAKLLGEKICRKTNLKQLFFSFSVDYATTQEFQKNFRLMMATEQKIS